jgi:hypothetical protein
VRPVPDLSDPADRDHMILARMLADAERLCGTCDALMAGQYKHLRGRIAALVEMTRSAQEAGA